MKKVLSLLLTCAMVLCMGIALSGCGSDDKKGGDSGDTAKADVHVFYYSYGDTYISSVRTALDAQFKTAGIKAKNYDGNNNQTTQTEQVDTAITDGAKVLIVNIVNSSSKDAAQGIVDKAKAKDIPVIFFNREVDNTVVNSYKDKCAFIGTDAAEAGHLQGKMIAEYLLKDYDKYDLNKDGKISYIMFKGEQGNNEAEMRTKFAVEDADIDLKKAGKAELEFYDSGNKDKFLLDKEGKWSAQAATEHMTTALASYSDTRKNMIELVICNNDGMAEGAVTALATAGYNTGSGKSIPVFGVDATDAAKALIKDGKMAGTIKQDADGMAKAIALLTGNVTGDKALMDGTKDLNIDKDVAKIRIAYAKYLGE